MSSLDLLKLRDRLLLAAGVPVGVAFQRELPESPADIVVVCIGGDAQVGVVVASRVGLDHVGGEGCGRV
jgi:hypothetical protein